MLFPCRPGRLRNRHPSSLVTLLAANANSAVFAVVAIATVTAHTMKATHRAALKTFHDSDEVTGQTEGAGYCVQGALNFALRLVIEV